MKEIVKFPEPTWLWICGNHFESWIWLKSMI